MLRPKVWEVLNERSRDQGNAHFFGCSWKITLVLLGDLNFEIRIGSKAGLVCWGQLGYFSRIYCVWYLPWFSHSESISSFLLVL
jgi:hypothetical protein